MRRLPITYKQWDAELQKLAIQGQVKFTKYGHPAGVIGNACEAYARSTGKKFPPINLLVVNQRYHIPGFGADSYVNRWLMRRGIGKKFEDLFLNEKQMIISEIHKSIFDFDEWPEVLQAFSLETTSTTVRPVVLTAAASAATGRNWATGPESEQHKSLKRFILEHPTSVELSKNITGEAEADLASGDRLDVFFRAVSIAVEVKTSQASESEMLRGVFQSVKYKAVLGAQHIAEGKVPTGNCYLATDGVFPKRVKTLCDLLDVRYFERVMP